MNPRVAGRWKATLLPIGLIAALVCSDLQAQVIQLRPLANVSFPTRFSLKDGDIQVRQKVSVAVGARMTMIFSELFDVVTTVSYSPGAAIFQGDGKGIHLAGAAHSLGASTRARYWLLPPPRKLTWEAHTGVGLVFGAQPGYESLFDGSTLSAVIGCTLRYQLGRIVALKLRIQERLYRIRFGAPERATPRRPFQVAFGLSFPFLEGMR